jgi:hypothetical protein
MHRTTLRGVWIVLAIGIGGWLVASASVAQPQAGPVEPDDKGPVTLRSTTLFNNFNSGGVVNQARAATTFTLSASRTITSIQTYHWNAGRGKAPGTIKLVSQTGRTFGPWQAKGSDGQGGVKNAFWTASLWEQVPAGTYTVVDSDPATWSNNAQSGQRGFAVVMGR